MNPRLLIIALAAASLSAGAFARGGEVRYSTCPAGTSDTFTLDAGKRAGNFDLRSVMRTTPSGGPFDLMMNRCIGSWNAVDGTGQAWGHCEWIDGDGDKILLRFSRLDTRPPNFEFLGGSGKFDGIRGRGEYTPRRLNAPPGDWYSCLDGKFSYTLPD